jgi:hypothetical protein
LENSQKSSGGHLGKAERIVHAKIVLEILSAQIYSTLPSVFIEEKR